MSIAAQQIQSESNPENMPADLVDSLVEEVRTLYSTQFPKKESGFYLSRDWNRCRQALPYIKGPKVLDVGVGPGQMFNILARHPEIEHLRGVDIHWNKKLIRPARGDLDIMSILDLRVPDDSMDTVVCMEVLEHLEIIDFPKALSELRRVCRGTLVMTVPFEEPEPLWHFDRPGGHRQQFTRDVIAQWFPRAEQKKVYRGKGIWPWIMLIERFDDNAW